MFYILLSLLDSFPEPGKSELLTNVRDEEVKAQRDWSCQDRVNQLVLFGVELEPRAQVLVATLLW